MNNVVQNSQRLWFVALAAVAVCLGGCGDTGRPKTIPISGRLTIDGQPPGESGKLFFTPTETAAGYSKRPASGTYLADGSYRVMSWAPDDGLVPGHYRVNLTPGDPNTAIPDRYRKSETSGLEVDVPVDESSIDYDIEVTTN